MALLEGTIAIILYIVLILIIFKLVRSIIKTVLLALLLVLAVVGVGGFLVISDFNDLRNNFANSTKTAYLVQGDDILAGYTFVDMDTQNMEFLRIEQMENLEEYYADDDYRKLIDEDYKIFIFELEVFNRTLEEGIDLEMEEISIHMDGDQINQSLYSPDPMEFFYDDVFESMIEKQQDSQLLPPGALENDEILEMMKEQFLEQVNESMITPGQGRAMIFSMLFKEKITSEDGLKELYRSYKDGNLKVYKETAFFKLIRYMPSSLIERFAFKEEVLEQDES